jgi:hypothetical protein
MSNEQPPGLPGEAQLRALLERRPALARAARSVVRAGEMLRATWRFGAAVSRRWHVTRTWQFLPEAHFIPEGIARLDAPDNTGVYYVRYGPTQTILAAASYISPGKHAPLLITELLLCRQRGATANERAVSKAFVGAQLILEQLHEVAHAQRRPTDLTLRGAVGVDADELERLGFEPLIAHAFDEPVFVRRDTLDPASQFARLGRALTQRIRSY